jgi:nitroreductase
VKLNLSVEEVLTTTRSVRKRLDMDKPVDRYVVERCIELAVQAPSGGNAQAWHWIIVEDQDLITAIAEKYKANFDKYTSKMEPLEPDDPRMHRSEENKASARYLADNMHRIPMLVLGCVDGRLNELPNAAQAPAWGSIIPALWSFNLALREYGLGTTWTTMHLMSYGEQIVAELLGIPFDTVTQVALFPIAHTIGTDFSEAFRQPISEFTHYNKW